MTAVHSMLAIRSADVPYDDQEQKLRSYLRKLSEKVDNGATGDEQIALRRERIPALILVGFEKHPSGNTDFATAVKSMVALRHVDPPKAWGEVQKTNPSLMSLDELYRQNLISDTKRAYFAGSSTRSEAEAAAPYRPTQQSGPRRLPLSSCRERQKWSARSVSPSPANPQGKSLPRG